MTTVFDIPADMLIRQTAEELKKNPKVQPPAWAGFAKTGIHKEMPPEDPEWWFTRAASVLRRVYIDGPVGVQRMRSFYGGARDRGSNPSQFRKGSGAVVRTLVQQLEEAGYIQHDRNGRKVSASGRAFLDGVARDLKPNVVEQVPELSKY